MYGLGDAQNMPNENKNLRVRRNEVCNQLGMFSIQLLGDMLTVLCSTFTMMGR